MADRTMRAHQVIELEFFHDVLCAWCYALSPQVRRLAGEYPGVRVVHRAFALAPTPDAIVAIFGSKETGEQEILSRWRAADRNDDAHRINAELMASRLYGITGVPTLVAEHHYALTGAQSYERLKAWLDSVLERRGPSQSATPS